MRLLCVAKQSARHKASAVCSERAGLTASADGLRRGKLSSAGAQLVCPHRCTGWRCRPLHVQGGVSTAWICRKKTKQLPPLLTWKCGHNSGLHTCVHQQTRTTLLTSLAKIFEINRENVQSKSWRLSGLECLFLQSRGDGVILNLFFVQRRNQKIIFFLQCPKTPQGCLSPIVLVKCTLLLWTLQGNAFKSLEDPARRGDLCPHNLCDKCTHSETISTMVGRERPVLLIKPKNKAQTAFRKLFSPSPTPVPKKTKIIPAIYVT